MFMLAAVALLAAAAPDQTVIRSTSVSMVDGDAVVMVRASGSWDPAQVEAQVERGLLFARVNNARLDNVRPTAGIRMRQVEDKNRVDVAVKLPAAIQCRTTPIVRSTAQGLSVLVHCPSPARAGDTQNTTTDAVAVPPPAVGLNEAEPAPASLPLLARPSAPNTSPWLAVVGGLLVGLAVLAVWLQRRKTSSAHPAIEVLQACSLGPKRALLLARVADKTLLLSSSETGIQLLTEVSHTPAAVKPHAAQRARTPASPSWAEGQAEALARASFEQALEDVGEDELLRRKLAGAVPRGHA